eukprot:TRINITY_DN534_c0_g1_i1.p1 TRINITY_DN534_c0_g1~~TRINITY_DN534_c0_g1_i1.p1  ORF type:complete len:149 (+),score=41.07 TRINITY_DN534_c0_g1_i1:3-449(+)
MYVRIVLVFGGVQQMYCSVSVFFYNDTATTEIYTILFVGSVRCVQETGTWARTAVLYQELESFMKENINEEQVLKENGEQKRLADQQAAERQEELSYLMEDSKTGNPGYVPNEPKEQQPIHHLPQIYGEKIHNEQIEKKNETETEQKA